MLGVPTFKLLRGDKNKKRMLYAIICCFHTYY